MAMAPGIYHHLPIVSSNEKGPAPRFTDTVIKPRLLEKHGQGFQGLHLPQSLSNILHLNLKPHPLHVHPPLFNINHSDQRTPTSPKEVIATKWREVHGSTNWDCLLDPLHPWLRREIIKYGEFAQATYDGFDFDALSEYCGSCRYNSNNLFKELGLEKNGYKVSKYIYAMSHVDLPRWLERSHLLDKWSKDSNWMGYVAVSDDDESKRIGRRDIVVAWRGTMSPSEWLEDIQGKLEPVGDGDVKVEHGFLSIYTSKSDSTRYNKSSASEQAMKEVKRLVTLYRERGEEVSLTITGHSLGGALALLNAYEAAASLPGIPVSVVTFGAPRVGNAAFKEKLQQLQVKTLRVVNKQDLVPRMPGIMFNEGLQKFEVITGPLQSVYTHVGVELKLDSQASPYLKHGFNLVGVHSLETYLHLVDGFFSATSSFRVDARRDVALVNKACGMLVGELRIPECWYQLSNKGLVCNSYGRWVKPQRDPEDIPSPSIDAPMLSSC
ncbi:phospholipase A1-Igamma1, chloroplastic-like protein [Cinnamomum micranthum f. kanehirae]|uniref:Phospholipase A1-Igamma1, chloroplastic-like protein n=1 Tax=Cinnamomum micranthum f. kanehirae TaxID=337451 RepID=A0A443PDA5_9MAGN|nr:phospholipase A1-Igamma1, chloroplastic-like protein [Cinnamomum micranthum f. kanehirae]